MARLLITTVGTSHLTNREEGIIGVCFGPKGEDLPLSVQTTASGNEQIELVAAHIRRIRQRF